MRDVTFLSFTAIFEVGSCAGPTTRWTHSPVSLPMRRGSLTMVTGLALGITVPGQAQAPGVTLEDAIRLAEQAQPSVVQARGQLQTADAELRSAKGAYLPSLALSGTGTESYSE